MAVIGLGAMSTACSPEPEAIVVNAQPASTANQAGTETTEQSPSTDPAQSSNTSAASGPGVDGSPLLAPLGVARALTLPSSFWAIDDLSFDLVAVTTSTGAIQQRVGGWGQEAAEQETPQVLTSVEASGTGLLWVGDCCEPATGNVFAIDHESSVTLPEGVVFERPGSSPQLSPDASLVAIGDPVIGVRVQATDGRDLAIDTNPVVEAAGVTAFDRVHPLAWLSDEVVVVSSSEGGTTSLIPVNVSGGTALAAGQPIEVDGLVVSGDVNNDGYLVLAVRTQPNDPATAGQVIDPVDGAITAAFLLPDDTSQIDYDQTGTYLLISTSQGSLSWQGNGDSGTIPGVFYAASW